MAKKNVAKNQNFNELIQKLNVMLTENNFMDEVGDFSKLTLKDECDDSCLDCRTVSESRPDPLRPGKKIIVLVRKCFNQG